MPDPAEAPYSMAMESLCHKLVTGHVGKEHIQALLSSHLDSSPCLSTACPSSALAGHCLQQTRHTAGNISVPQAEGSLHIALDSALLGRLNRVTSLQAL